MAQHPSHAPVPSKPKKSSNVVTLSVIGAVSVMVVGYCAATSGAKSVTADCVDSRRAADGSYTVVEDRYCDDDARYYGGSRGAYHWYYGGTRVGSRVHGDRKSTRLNSSHVKSSYAVFCLKKKKIADA